MEVSERMQKFFDIKRKQLESEIQSMDRRIAFWETKEKEYRNGSFPGSIHMSDQSLYSLIRFAKKKIQALQDEKKYANETLAKLSA